MKLGVHLPQYGRTAGPEAIHRAARHAEELGYADVWISDHLVHPAEQEYPSPYLLDPLVSLTWAAAVTSTIGLGTSVLVAPQRNPLQLANQLATLDNLSGGRLTAGVGTGWSKREFEALGWGFEDRGARTDEIIDALRTCWRDDPSSVDGQHVSFRDIRVLPKPAHDIPIWVGGSGERAHRRAVEKGDGFHAIGLTPQTVGPVVERIRRDRPDPTFVISLRTGWDPQGMEPDLIREEREAFEEAGIQHVVAAPWRNDIDAWLRSMDLLAEIVL
jgi:probable F420-dependent oxidoreductase